MWSRLWTAANCLQYSKDDGDKTVGFFYFAWVHELKRVTFLCDNGCCL